MAGLGARPQLYHGDSCGCGCGELVCVYHMPRHSANQHTSTVHDCFRDASLNVSLLAAMSMEVIARKDPSRPPAADRTLESINRFLAVLGPIVVGSSGPGRRRLKIGQVTDTRMLSSAFLIALVPAIANSVRLSWLTIVNAPLMKPRGGAFAISDRLASRLNEFVKFDADISGAPFSGRSIQAYSLLSPMLPLLFPYPMRANLGFSHARGIKERSLQEDVAAMEAWMFYSISAQSQPGLTKR
jgi:hypothetical protein